MKRHRDVLLSVLKASKQGSWGAMTYLPSMSPTAHVLILRISAVKKRIYSKTGVGGWVGGVVTYL